MVDSPDIWPGDWPEPQARGSSPSLTPVRPIGNRAPRFGVAHELDRPGAPWRPRSTPAAAPRDGLWSRLGSWWAGRETLPADLWHRMRCRSGRHQIQGGQQIQLGSRFVRTERCCVWCGHKPW